MSTDDAEDTGAAGTAGTAGTADAPSPASPLEALLEVQDLDTALAQLEHRRSTLPERQELARVTLSLSEAGRRHGEVQASRAGLLERQRALEEDIATAAERREALEQRMYAARGAPARDLQAMDEEIGHLRARREQLEDAELEVMVELEPLDAELATLEAQGRALRTEAEHLREALVGEESVIDDQLVSQRTVRDQLAAGLPDELRARYESLRARLGGTGAARLVGNRCSGCHLELPSMEVDRIRHLPPGSVVTCEQCGRILVAAPAPGS